MRENIYEIKDKKFKSLLISLNLFLPLNKENFASNALVASILRNSTQKYSTKKELEIYLASLYHTDITVSVDKYNNEYKIEFCLEVLNKKYIDKDILTDALELLNNILTNPKLKNGVFSKEITEREKNRHIDKLEQIKNNKKSYALFRLEQEMFATMDIGTSALGMVEEIKLLDENKLYNRYLEIIKNARVEVVVVGNTEGYENIKEDIYNNISIIRNNNNNKPIEKVTIKSLVYRPTVNIINEEEKTNQSILALGLNIIDVKPEDYYALCIYSSILGETPSSKLFQNVREKESLAYFTRSKYDRHQNAIYIAEGIDISKYEKALKVTKYQIELMKNGQISNAEFEAGKMHNQAFIKGIVDNKNMLAKVIVSNKEFFGREVNLDEMLKKIDETTVEDVRSIAKKIKLDTIYFLGGTNVE